MTDIVLSFIIPIYNAEKNIKNCINSIVRENENNYEIILINDGSTDKSKEVCDEIVSSYNNIKVMHTVNNGQGKARNLGLDIACGKYVMFVDIDDEIILSGVNNMLDIALKGDYDIVCSTYYRIENSGENLVLNDFKSGEVTAKGTLEDRDRYNKIKNKSVFGYLWNKVIKTSFITQNGVRLDNERKVFMEDFIFNLKLWLNNPRYYYTQTPSYRFDVRYNSTTRQNDEFIAEKTIKTIENFYSYMNDNNLYIDNLEIIIPMSIRILAYALIKNIPYEGLSFKKLMSRINLYANSFAYKSIVNTENASKSFKSLQSLPEKVLYKYCLFCLKHKLKGLIALLFFVFYPVFKIYLTKNVK